MPTSQYNYDAIVVGARVAGSPTAMLLARRGYKVLLVDKATFPSDTISTHNLTLAAMAALKRWGLYDTIAATDCPPVNSVVFDLDGLVLEGWSGPFEGVDLMYNLRRSTLDDILVRAAAKAGAEVQQAFTVEELIVESGVCQGIRGRTKDGEAVEARAPIVVGADGRHSRIAATMGAEAYRKAPAATFTYYSYYHGLDMRGRMEFMDRSGMTIIAQPTSGGETMVAIIQPAAAFKSFRADIEGNFKNALAAAPEFAERVATATRVERFLGTIDVPSAVRVPYGPGFALVGDAGLHMDPTMGQGITNAFRDAEFLAEAIDQGLSGARPMQEALGAYHQRRDSAVLPMFELVCEMISGEPPSDEIMAVFEALPGNQHQIDRFIGVMLGSVAIEDFYSPENMAAIVQGRAREPLAA